MDLELAFNFIKVEGMWCLLYMLVILCVGDKSVYSVQPEFALSSNIGKNKLNFGYGVNFKYNGEIHNNLDRVWVVQRFNLPKGLTSYFTGMKFGLNCEYKNLSPQSTGKTWAIDAVSRVSFIREVCRQTRPMLAQLEKGAYFYQKTIERLVNGDIPNALHRLPVVDPDKHVTPEHLQAGKPGNTHVEKVYTNTSLSKQDRKKRGILGIALPICHSCCVWTRVLWQVARQRPDGDQLVVAGLGQLVMGVTFIPLFYGRAPLVATERAVLALFCTPTS